MQKVLLISSCQNVFCEVMDLHCPHSFVEEYGVFDSHVKFPKMTTTAPRQVESYELEFYAADTTGKTWLNGRWYPLLRGTFVCAKPGCTRRSILPFRCYYIHLQTTDPALTVLLDKLPDIFSLPHKREATALWTQMLALEPEDRPEDRLLLHSCILQVIHLICRHWQTARDVTAERVFLHQKKLLFIEQHIREHLSEDLKLEGLAALCNLSPTYFHSIFTEFFHKTPAQYILDCRITAAKTGLLTGDYSLTELAADCGFSSQSYFCYKFRQVTGQTPLQYRRENLGRMEL